MFIMLSVLEVTQRVPPTCITNTNVTYHALPNRPWSSVSDIRCRAEDVLDRSTNTPCSLPCIMASSRSKNDSNMLRAMWEGGGVVAEEEEEEEEEEGVVGAVVVVAVLSIKDEDGVGGAGWFLRFLLELVVLVALVALV